MTTPNSALRAVRLGMRMSQDEFAHAIQTAGERAGWPNDANKRLVQRWEAGTSTAPRPVYARALEAATGLPLELLGFADANARVSDDGRGGHDVDLGGTIVPAPPAPTGQAAARGNLSGVWLSRYEYFSSGRSATFAQQHHVILLQHGDRLTVRSLPHSADSALSMDLTVDAGVLTGVWTEQTSSEGYYRGARYHGAVQMLSEPTGHRLVGKWVGFGKQMDVNTGPWELVFQDSSTGKATLDRYDRPPE